jgi:FAD/FMN-containing dehydrogenase
VSGALRVRALAGLGVFSYAAGGCGRVAPLRRRDFVSAGLAAAAVSAWPFGRAKAVAASRVRPGAPGWPRESEWAQLAQATGGRLSKLAPPASSDLASNGRNPFFRGDTPSLTENVGWLDAWRSEPSAYVVAAESASDVAAAVRFADAHNLRLVVKGGGHSYLGTSCAPDSLLIWTRKMNAIAVHSAFTPQGGSAPAVPAISLGAGCIWLHAYQAAAGAKRYVQGGGCTTVGVGGLLLGGGFGSFSKRYGLAAASLLEAEIVTADGGVRIVNAAREPDLFWALKGGGGGSFGVVTRFTLATHELPDQFGGLNWTVRARSDEAYRNLIARFVDHYADTLLNPHWGETAHFAPDNLFRLSMVFQGLTGNEAEAAFAPLARYVAEHPADFETQNPPKGSAVQASWFWSASLFHLVGAGIVDFDSRPGANWNDFWWNGDGGQAGAFWDAYQSMWLPAALLDPPKRASLADALFAASRRWYVELHFNKGLAGAPAEVIAAARDTPVNADVASAFALAIVASNTPNSPADGSPDMAQSRERAKRVGEAMAALRTIAPGSGSYFNECDYFLDDWQRAQWGDNYPRLAAVKQTYDPKGLFTVHHGAGSESWSADGFTRT